MELGEWVAREKTEWWQMQDKKNKQENEQRCDDIHEMISRPVSINSTVFPMIG